MVQLRHIWPDQPIQSWCNHLIVMKKSAISILLTLFRSNPRPCPISEWGNSLSDPTDPDDRLAALEARLAAKRAPQKVKDHAEEHYSQAQLAWRMVIELVAGLAIGFGIGYGLDYLLGTQPFMMVLFIFFGLAAGVLTMVRSAKEVQTKQEAAQAARDEGDESGD
ncbi:FoF1-type ATP synthase assembly protein I [Cognatiyoonia koreensis]|uniref:FoF1-type ATP synthase assembly protein I n=1 Tax=Cognatiyoonia koreensis TaxID=364200 RepID=A0A1I0QX25_9RHOB|nr:FoF1-type ATP synthase assembly protein I [Cognatiyoonia koreensis]